MDTKARIHDFQPVRWLLGGTIMRKLVQLVRGGLISNELDLRDWMAWPEDIDFRSGGEELWFDYIADTGDDSVTMQAMGSCLSQTFTITEDNRKTLPEALRREAEVGTQLPCGRFVFTGGDTAYVVADEETIHDRLVAPFNEAAKAYPAPHVRTLLGIPGNHDHFDDLVGFNRMFRRKPPHGPALLGPVSTEALPLTGFVRRQDASYVRVLLPGDWQLWGADSWKQAVDYRQRAYFRPEGAPPPKNLILCMPTPPIAFNADLTDAPDKESFTRLLGTPEAPFDVGNHMAGGVGDRALLVLSGDTHHYERYESPDRSMISIVSGGGGAFLHPTETVMGSIEHKAAYPSVACSRRHVARRLATVIPTMYGAGLVWLFGGVLAWLFQISTPSSIVHVVPWAALRLWTTVIASGALLVGSHLTHAWIATQRRQFYEQRTKRYTQAPTAPSKLYLAVRDTGLGWWCSRWGISRGLGWVARIAAFGVAFALPYLLREWWGDSTLTAGAIASTGLALVMLIGLVALALLLGGPPGRPAKALFAALGVTHAAFQIALPLLVVRYADRALLPHLAGCLVFAGLGWALYKRHVITSFVVLFAWIALGASVPLVLPLAAAPHVLASHESFAYAFLAGVLITPAMFSWYLLVAGCFNGHNNEIGIVIRSTHYKQWIRFHVTKERVTGYVIGIDRPREALSGGDNPLAAAFLRDVFTIQAR